MIQSAFCVPEGTDVGDGIKMYHLLLIDLGQMINLTLRRCLYWMKIPALGNWLKTLHFFEQVSWLYDNPSPNRSIKWEHVIYLQETDTRWNKLR
jgi:hypothetical protein